MICCDIQIHQNDITQTKSTTPLNSNQFFQTNLSNQLTKSNFTFFPSTIHTDFREYHSLDVECTAVSTLNTWLFMRKENIDKKPINKLLTRLSDFVLTDLVMIWGSVPSWVQLATYNSLRIREDKLQLKCNIEHKTEP